jgi:hypothetical protein
MKLRNIIVLVGLLGAPLVAVADGGGYDASVSNWKSHADVGQWLDKNFSFDSGRQGVVSRRLKSQGAAGLLVWNPEKVYEKRQGYCVDAANFALHSLNRIDSAYNARWVFVENAKGRPNHWVTAFDYENKLYVMDYGTGDKWRVMKGIHGPYDSLGDYRAFLASLNVPGFAVGNVIFRDMPGQED